MDIPKKRLKVEQTGAVSSSDNKGPGFEPICIIHSPDSTSDKIILLSEVGDANERFQKLQDVCKQRLAQPLGSVHRMPDICSQLPASYSPDCMYGYHRDCYQRFTGNMNRLIPAGTEESSSTSTRSKRVPSVGKFLFSPECIFCNKDSRKKVKKGKSWTSEPLSKFEFGGWEATLHAAEEKNDFDILRKIKGFDLFACEAQFHSSCRKAYTRSASWLSSDVTSKTQQCAMEAAHKVAYSEVCASVEEQLVKTKGVIKLAELRKIYIGSLSETPFSNPNYRSENLKIKLAKSFGEELSFVQMDNKGQFQSCLVYTSSIDVGSLVQMTYDLSLADRVSDVAQQLRSNILDAFKASEDLRWPPTARDLELHENVLPENLEKFLNLLLTGTAGDAKTTRVQRLVLSLGQDICRATTNGLWKLPKHILLCMTLRHMFRSAELITLVSRLGHCENYSYSVELETALAIMVQQSSNLLTSQIVRQPSGSSLFHSDFDNFDKFTATGSVHTAHGIMLQEVDGQDGTGGNLDIPSLERTKQRSLDVSAETDDMPDCYVTHRKSPAYNISTWTCTSGENATEEANETNSLWLFCRVLSSSSGQEVPGWSGFISSTGVTPISTTTVDYYPVINCPITDYKTVQQCLQYSESATREVGQDYVITSFDLGVCMKAFPLVWNNPLRYEKHIVMVGSFHVVCAYLKMLGKKMNGTGLDDILVEAGLITSGSLSGVLSGKNYSRAMLCHKTTLEALERLLLIEYLVVKNKTGLLDGTSNEQDSILKDLLEMPSQQTLSAAKKDQVLLFLVQDYLEFKEFARDGGLGKTATLWIAYMDHVWLILNVTQAVKNNDFDLYCHSLFKMADLFFSFDGQNYARYLTFFSVFLANVDQTHPGAQSLLERGAFSVARSFIPGNRCPVDKTIEETFMKHSKSHGGAGGCGAGLTGLVNDYKAYQRWVKTTHERAQFVEVMLSMADMLSESREGRKHKDLRPAEVKKGEQRVDKTVEAIKGFINPFDMPDETKLYCLSSGAPASDEIETDVLNAELKGKEAKETFIKERLEKKEHFFDPVKKMRLKTMGDNKKPMKLTTTKNKVIEYRQQGNIMLQLLMKSLQGGTVEIDDLVTYPLTPVPYSLATADGFLNRNDKSRGFKLLTKDVENATLPPAATTLTVEDGNAIFHYLRELPGNFKQICQKLFDMMAKTSDVLFSTDMYFPDSVKAVERKKRGCGEKFIIQGEMTKRPADWKGFLTNDENKVQLIRLILQVWSLDEFAAKYENRKVILITEGHAHCLDSDEDGHTKVQEIPCLFSNQEETDSRVVLYCQYAHDQGYEYVRIRSPDSDVFFILLHHAPNLLCTILFDTGSGNNKRLINITQLVTDFTQEYCTALMALHAFTHCDSTSAFKGIGKVKPIKVLQKNPRFQRILARLGEEWDVTDEMIAGLEAFTCAIYGRNKITKVDELRCILLREKCEMKDGNISLKKNIDLCSLPPCKKSLVQHIHRVNFQVAIWRRAGTPLVDVPPATNGHGWTLTEGEMAPLWYEGDCLPEIRVDDDSVADESDESDKEGEDEYEINDSESDDDY